LILVFKIYENAYFEVSITYRTVLKEIVVIFWGILCDSCDCLLLCDFNDFMRLYYLTNGAGFV